MYNIIFLIYCTVCVCVCVFVHVYVCVCVCVCVCVYVGNFHHHIASSYFPHDKDCSSVGLRLRCTQDTTYCTVQTFILVYSSSLYYSSSSFFIHLFFVFFLFILIQNRRLTTNVISHGSSCTIRSKLVFVILSLFYTLIMIYH